MGKVFIKLYLIGCQSDHTIIAILWTNHTHLSPLHTLTHSPATPWNGLPVLLCWLYRPSGWHSSIASSIQFFYPTPVLNSQMFFFCSSLSQHVSVLLLGAFSLSFCCMTSYESKVTLCTAASLRPGSQTTPRIQQAQANNFLDKQLFLYVLHLLFKIINSLMAETILY